MKTKKYKSKEKPLPQVEEPVATYGPTAANSNDMEAPINYDIPKGYMSLQQFEKELVKAVSERL